MTFYQRSVIALFAIKKGPDLGYVRLAYAWITSIFLEYSRWKLNSIWVI